MAGITAFFASLFQRVLPARYLLCTTALKLARVARRRKNYTCTTAQQKTSIWKIMSQTQFTTIISRVPALIFLLASSYESPKHFCDSLQVSYKVWFVIIIAMLGIVKGSFALEQLCSFFSLNARWWYVVNATPRPLYPRGRDPVPIA